MKRRKEVVTRRERENERERERERGLKSRSLHTPGK